VLVELTHAARGLDRTRLKTSLAADQQAAFARMQALSCGMAKKGAGKRFPMRTSQPELNAPLERSVPVPLGCVQMSGIGPSLPSPAFAGHGSYQGISCRQRRSCTTVGDDPGCVRTRSLFSKIEFPSEFRSDEASGGHSIRDYGQNRENNFLQFSSRQVFTQPGPRAETAATCRLHPDPHPQKSGFSAHGTLVSLWS